MTPDANAVADAMGRGPDQVAFVATDLEAACTRLGVVLGIGPWDGYLYDPSYLPTRVYRGRPGRFVSRTAATGAGPQVEVIQPLEGPSVFTEHLDRHGPGLHHFGYRVDSLATTRHRFASLGLVEVQSGGGHGLDGDGEFAFFEVPGPVGLLIECFQPPRRRAVPHFRLA